MKPRQDIVAAMELLLTKRQIARIMDMTGRGNDRVAVMRRVVNAGLDRVELEHWDKIELAEANSGRIVRIAT